MRAASGNAMRPVPMPSSLTEPPPTNRCRNDTAVLVAALHDLVVARCVGRVEAVDRSVAIQALGVLT